MHFIGEISGAEGFGSGISCRFRVEGGRHWTCLAGLEEGQTHVMHMDYGEAFAPWNHPIDLHYTTKSIQVDRRELALALLSRPAQKLLPSSHGTPQTSPYVPPPPPFPLLESYTQGWPRLTVQVWQLDTHGRNVLRGYGFRHLPSTPGFSEVSVPCWRPSGTMQVSPRFQPIGFDDRHGPPGTSFLPVRCAFETAFGKV